MVDQDILSPVVPTSLGFGPADQANPGPSGTHLSAVDAAAPWVPDFAGITDQADMRAAIVLEAMSWVGTAYHHMGRVKIHRDQAGRIVDPGGTDCGQLVYLVFHALGLCREMPLDYYPPDWHLHRDRERYLGLVLERAREVPAEQAAPGDVVLYRWGRLFAHGGIVIDRGGYEQIVHASAPDRAVVKTRADAGRLGRLPRRYFSVFQS